MRIAGRINRLETKFGLRGPCRECGDQSCLQIVIDTPDWPAATKEPENCPACGRPPYLIRIVPAVVPTLAGHRGPELQVHAGTSRAVAKWGAARGNVGDHFGSGPQRIAALATSDVEARHGLGAVAISPL